MSLHQLIWADIIKTYQDQQAHNLNDAVGRDDEQANTVSANIAGMLAIIPLIPIRITSISAYLDEDLKLILYSTKSPKRLQIDCLPERTYRICLFDEHRILLQEEFLKSDAVIQQLVVMMDDHLSYPRQNLKFGFETDHDTQLFYETIAHFLSHFFDHSEADSVAMVTEYVIKHRAYRDDEFYYHRGEFESAVRIHYHLYLRLDERDFMAWAIANERWGSMPPYARDYLYRVNDG